MSEFAPLSLSFMIVVALLYSALVMGALWANNRIESENRWPVRLLRFFVGGFLILVGMLALDRFFSDWNHVPPHMAYAIVPAMVGMVYLAFHPLTLRWIREIPQRWLIGLQSFRIVIEIQLYYLYGAGLIPRMLTFEGRNFDILVGLSAPVVAWYVHRAHKQNRGLPQLVAGWNAVGLILLTNVVIHALLAMPTPFQVFTEPPGNIGMAFFPWIWLPTFVVPFAYLLHILSLRREFAFQDKSYKKRPGESLEA